MKAGQVLPSSASALDEPRLGQRLVARSALQLAALVDQLNRVEAPEAGSDLPVDILTAGIDSVQSVTLAALQPPGPEVDRPRLGSFDVVF